MMDEAKIQYAQKEKEIGEESMRKIEKLIVLQTIDTLWMGHLDEIDYLRQGIGLRGYGQRDPLIEYKREAFSMFTHLMDNITATIVRTIFKVSLRPMSTEEAEERRKKENWQFKGGEPIEQFGAARRMQEQARAQGSGGESETKQAPIINKNTVGRNDPCPCGSGKKYKKCCGK
jgi:preprotein translocase subunit SecA